LGWPQPGRTPQTSDKFPDVRLQYQSKGIKLARSDERRRTSRDNQHHDARPSKEIISKSSATLVACSEELLKGFLIKYGATTIRHDIFKGLLKAKLGDKFRRMQRKHRQKALAVASAVYHVISRKSDSVAALDTLVQRMNVSPPRGSDLCRTIVECLVDYGSTPEERTDNRQYACTDANALRYIIRKGIEPQKVLAPEDGESITTWAKREAKYRKPKKAPDTRREVPEAITVTELASFTVDEAKRRPDKVRAAIEKTLDKAIQKAAEKPPATPLVRRPIFNARRSIPSGPHPKVLSKSVGQGPVEKPAGAKEIESPCP
jgi:hypothetical protein